MEGKTIAQLSVGDFAVSTHRITESDAAAYAQVTDDYNPIHFDDDYAAATPFGRKIAHGMILAGYLSGVIGIQLPGPGSLYETQTFRFLRPVYFGETITSRVEVVALFPERNRVRLKTECFNQDGVCVLDGEAVILPKKQN